MALRASAVSRCSRRALLLVPVGVAAVIGTAPLSPVAATSPLSVPTTVRVSVSSSGDQANGPSGRPAFSADGAHVAFPSSATNLVDDGGGAGVFVRVLLGSTERASVNDGGLPVRGSTGSPAISGDGRLVAFER